MLRNFYIIFICKTILRECRKRNCEDKCHDKHKLPQNIENGSSILEVKGSLLFFSFYGYGMFSIFITALTYVLFQAQSKHVKNESVRLRNTEVCSYENVKFLHTQSEKNGHRRRSSDFLRTVV